MTPVKSEKRKIIVSIEARMTSSRLPGKVLLDLGGRPALEQMITRIRQSKCIDDIVVATTINPSDDAIVQLCEKLGCHYFRGDEHDVLLRVLRAAQKFNATHVVGLTGDCPLIDPGHIDQVVEYFFANDFDYVTNRLSDEGLPAGFDVQIYKVADLAKIETLTKDPTDRVHVTCYFYNHPAQFKIGVLSPKKHDLEYWPELAVTLDEPSDYLLLKEIFAADGGKGAAFSAKEIISYLKAHPQLVKINQEVRRKQLHEG